MQVKIESSWKESLADEFSKDYFSSLSSFVKSEYLSKTVYPRPENVFNAFNLCPFSQTKVVILGQDPYHGPNQAHGLSFSVEGDVSIPPSLRNIYKEINSDLGSPLPSSGNLEHWAKQGVLLLNATLTVLSGSPMSHYGKGWEQFTDAVIEKLSTNKENLVFVMWGKSAQQKGSFVDEAKHLVLRAAHPSPLSAHNGFFGCKHFSQTNTYLQSHGKAPIEWTQ